MSDSPVLAPDACPACGGALLPFDQFESEPLSAANPSAVDVAFDQGIDVDASSSSSTTIPGRGELKKCAWCGRLVRANVSENRESGAATQAAVEHAHFMNSRVSSSGGIAIYWA